VGEVGDLGSTAEGVKATGVGKLGVTSVVLSTAGFTGVARFGAKGTTFVNARFGGVAQLRVSGAREVLSRVGFTGVGKLGVSSVIPVARIFDQLVNVDGSGISDADVRLRRLDKPGTDTEVFVDQDGFWEVLIIGAPGGTEFQVVESVPNGKGGYRTQIWTFALPSDEDVHWVKELV
jgi:hypothetical protein